MKINFDTLLFDGNDAVVMEGEAPADVKVILKRAVLSDMQPNGQPIQPEQKLQRFDLFLKLRSADNDTDWSLDEVALLDKAVMVFPTLISGQLSYLLNQKAVK